MEENNIPPAIQQLCWVKISTWNCKRNLSQVKSLKINNEKSCQYFVFHLTHPGGWVFLQAISKWAIPLKYEYRHIN